MKYILGGGIAGLIFCYYNRDFKIITKDIGGQFNNYFSVGPRYLHRTPNSVRFLKQLKLPVTERIIKVGYCLNGEFIHPNEEFRKKYFMKSRGLTELTGYDLTVMNKNESKFSVLDVDFTLLIKKLATALKRKIIVTDIVKIDLTNKKIIAGKKSYEYKRIVSTIPKNIFLWLCGIPNNLKSSSMTYVLLKSEYFDCKKFDYVYNVSKSVAHRFTSDNKDKTRIVADVFGEHTKEEMQKAFGKYFIDCITLKNAQIIPANVNLNDNAVTFVGRYGKWCRKEKTETVIDFARQYKREKRDM